jgi:hypothetical protein
MNKSTQQLLLDDVVLTDEVTSVDDYVGTVFLVPFDTPIPNELATLPIADGSLLQRLQMIGKHDVESFEVLPLRGDEMLQLARIWSLLADHKKIYVLRGLPGTRYDVLFDQGARAIGLPDLQWPNLASALARSVIERQRNADSKPWKGGASLATESEIESITTKHANARKPAGPGSFAAPLPKPLAAPGDGEED